MYKVFQTGSRIAAGDYLGAGAIWEQLLNQVHGLANAAGRGEGTEISGAVIGHLSGYVNPGKFFRKIYLQKGVGLVVFEACVVSGAVPLDQGVFQDQRFGLGISDDEFKIGNLRHQATNLRAMPAGRTEVGAQSITQDAGFPDVKDIVSGVLHQVDPGLFRSDPQAMLEGRLSHLGR